MEEMTREEARKQYKESGGRIVDQSVNSFICLKNVNKIYPNGVQAVFDFCLDVDINDFVALVGPSGCGKSTTLRMIAGLEEISSGYLYIDGVMSNYLPSKNRDIAMVFQNYALYPQLDVYDNIAFGLKIRKMDKKEIENRVFEAADILDLGPYLDRKPKELSGGQMQRVALGRAIVRKAKLFLMDEPLSNLDAKLRVQMRSEIVRIHKEVGATTIYVTHDQTEAMTMANKIVVMNKGFIQQTGAPLDIYHYPKTLFVATFIGTPPMNIFDCTYNGGVITFKDGSTYSLPKDARDRYSRFMSAKLEEIKGLIARTDELEPDYLKTYLLSRNLINVAARTELEKPKKENFITKLKNKFKNGAIAKLIKKIKDKKRDPGAVKEEYRKILEQTAERYEKAASGEHTVKFGIRPEYIDLTAEGESETFTVCPDIVEILGSEFIAYAKGEIGQIVVKSQTPMQARKPLKISFNFNKIHLFDPISEESILFDEENSKYEPDRKEN